MTDRVHALTVILEGEMRTDDVEEVIHAIRMIRRVRDVKPLISNPDAWWAYTNAKDELREELRKVLWPEH